jgi:hypothetical protein
MSTVNPAFTRHLHNKSMIDESIARISSIVD